MLPEYLKNKNKISFKYIKPPNIQSNQQPFIYLHYQQNHLNMSLPNIISPEGQIVIKNFKYKGGSISYSYNLLWSPLAEALLNYVPTWWAPNAITLAGFLINVVGCLTLILQGQIGEPVVPWTLIFFSLCVFTYQTLDNIDGKQARKTGNSTPLGMLFDHGCDAFGLIFLTLAVTRIVCLQNKETILYVGFVGVIFGFYFSVWCQYYSKGIMILGQVNAVDDGIPAVWMMGVITFAIGQQFWRQPLGEFWSISLTPGICIAYGILCSSILQIWSLLNHSKNNFTRDYIGAIANLLHVGLIVLTLVCIIEFSTLYRSNFYAIFFSLSIMFVRNIIYMQLCVTAEMKYQQFQPSTVLFIVGYTAYIGGLDKFVSKELFIYSVLAFIVVDFAYFVLKVIFEFRKILNIRVFRIGKMKKEKL